MAILQVGCLDIGFGKHAVTHQNTIPPPATQHTYRFQKWVEGPQSGSILRFALEEVEVGWRAPVYKAVNPFMVPGG